MEECVDGDYQAFKAKGGAYIRSEFFGKYPELLEMVSDMTDDEIFHMMRGGHDPVKVYNAYKRAVEHTGGPTVILAKTVKGYGLASTQARNASHQEKKLTDDALEAFVKRFDIPIPVEDAKKGKFYRPAPDSPEIVYLQERRKELGGYMPDPRCQAAARASRRPQLDFFAEWTAGSKGRAVSTTMGFVSMLRHLMKDNEIGKLIVPIVPDEGRTFGLESAIRQVGIYAPEGQKYKPARRRHAALLPRRERRPDPRRRHHRSRLHGLVHRRRHRLLQLPRAHDSLLHVLLDVRLPAHRRHGLGLRRLARQAAS